MLLMFTDEDEEMTETITAYISSKLEPNWMYIKFSKSIKNPVIASDCIQKYLAVAYIVNNLLGTSTPEDWDDAPGELIKEVSYSTTIQILLTTFY